MIANGGQRRCLDRDTMIEKIEIFAVFRDFFTAGASNLDAFLDNLWFEFSLEFLYWNT